MATYSALRDQTSAVWYLTAEGRPDTTAAGLAVSTSRPPGTNVTPTEPSWLVIEAPDLTRWYVSPTPTGELWLASAPPAIGSGASFATGLPLTDADDHRWLVGANAGGELTIGVNTSVMPTPRVIFIGRSAPAALISVQDLLIWENAAAPAARISAHRPLVWDGQQGSAALTSIHVLLTWEGTAAHAELISAARGEG